MDGQNRGDLDEYESAATTYVSRYFDAVQNLPNDLQRLISQVRELDTHTCTELRDYEQRHQAYLRDIEAGDNSARRKSHLDLRRSLLRERQYGDEKLQLASQLLDMIEVPSKQLDEDFQMLEAAQLDAELARNGVSRDENTSFPIEAIGSQQSEDKPSNAKQRRKRQRNDKEVEPEPPQREAAGAQKVKKKAKVTKKVLPRTPVEPVIPAPIPIDPNEPTYCLCGQVSFGDMIGCDNDHCPMEWFHFQCVGLTSKPKGKWYCPQCRREQHRSEHKHDKIDRSDKQKSHKNER